MRASSWNQSSSGLPLVAAIVARMSGTFFLKTATAAPSCAWGAGRRGISIAQRAQFAAQDLFGARDAILIEHPLREIDQPPAHDPMDRRGRTGLDHCDERAPLLVIEFEGCPVDLPSTRPSGPLKLNRRTQSR